MPLVLAIEPDLRQATIVKRIVREKVLADVAVVDSRDAALEAIRIAMPDVLLISALLSPRDEDELIAHLRTLDNASHLQTHTIPQLASALMPGEERPSGGLLSAFRRKKKKDPEAAPPGCDPDIFAEEIRSYLQRAAEKKRERVEGEVRQDSHDHTWRAARPKAVTADPEPPAETEPSGPSSWASPFEWKPSNPSSLIANPESLIASPESLIANPESLIAEPESLIANPESLVAEPESLIANPESLIGSPESVFAEPVGLVAESGALVAEPDEPPTLMAHLRPPSGVTTLRALTESLAAESAQLTAPVEAPRQEPVMEIVEVAAATPDPEPILAAAPILEPEPVQEASPILEAPLVREPAPIAAAAPLPIKDSGSGIKDSGSGNKDSGLGIREKRLGIRDPRFGALASWARAERPGRDAVEKADDMYGLLMGLAVPPAVVAVGYGRGCRIRRVRVPAASEPVGTEPNGPVILSKSALADLRTAELQGSRTLEL